MDANTSVQRRLRIPARRGICLSIENEIKSCLTMPTPPLFGLNTMNSYQFSDREGKPSSSSKGKYLRPLFWLAIHRLTLRNVPSDKVLGISSILENAVIDICHGQFMDISFGDAPTVRVKEYLQMSVERRVPSSVAPCWLHQRRFRYMRFAPVLSAPGSSG